MKNGNPIPLGAPDSERAFFDTINYRGACRLAEAEAAQQAMAARKQEKRKKASTRARARKEKARRRAAWTLAVTWICTILICVGLRALRANGTLSWNWTYLLTAVTVCAATYITGYLNGRKLW